MPIPPSLRCRAPIVASLLLALACRAPFQPDDTTTLPPPPPSGPLLPLRIGSLGPDFARAVATDAGGNAFVASYFSNTVDFDAGSGATERIASGPYDIALAKYGPDGTFKWVLAIGGTDADVPYQVKLGADGAAYVTGYLTTGAICSGRPVLNQGGRDIFLMRVSPAGTCDWVVDVGGTGDDQAHDLAVDNSGDLLITGFFSDTVIFAPGIPSAVLISRGGTDGFVARFGPDGAFRGAAQFGGTGDDAGNAIAIRPDGDVIVAGSFSNTATFGSALAPLPLISAGGFDYFVARFTPTLGLQWAIRGGGLGNDIIVPGGVVIGADGLTYVAGTFSGTASVGAGSGAQALVSHGDADFFIANYDGNGVWASLARAFGGTGTDAVSAFTRDATGNFYLGGSFQGSVDFQPGSGAHILNAQSSNGAADAFILSLTPAGDFRWVDPISATVSGSDKFAITSGIAVANDGALWAVGRFFGLTDFDPGVGAVERTIIGDADQFIVRYDLTTGALRQ